MSNSKNAINQIKNLMKEFGFLAEEESVMASFKLEDNTILQTSKLEAGSKIVKINEVFEQVSLETGSYRLLENFEIEVVDGEITAVKEIFVDAKLVDGTQVKVEGDTIVEGAKVSVVTDQGDMPAADGTYELEDGSSFDVKDGAIVMVVAAPADEENPAEGVGEPAEVEPMMPGMAMSEEVMSLLQEFIKKMSEKMNAMEAQLKKVEGEFNSFKKEPAGKKIPNGKSDFNKVENVSSKDDAMVAAIMNLRKNNK